MPQATIHWRQMGVDSTGGDDLVLDRPQQVRGDQPSLPRLRSQPGGELGERNERETTRASPM